MRRVFAILAILIVAGVSVRGAGSDEIYVGVYNEIVQGDNLLQSGHTASAIQTYQQAQADLLRLQAEHPSWNPDIVKFRLGYLTDKLAELQKSRPASSASQTAVSPATTQSTAPGRTATSAADQSVLQQQNAGYQEQIRALTQSNSQLANKLKEALSVQPAASGAAELAKAQDRIAALQKERDLLSMALEQEKSNSAKAVAAAKAASAGTGQASAIDKARAEADAKKAREDLALAQSAAAAAQKKLSDATADLAAARAELEQSKAANLKLQRELALTKTEADQSDAKYADAQKQLASMKNSHAVDSAAQARIEAAAKSSQEEVSRLRDAALESAKIIAAANRELELLRSIHPPDTAAPEAPKMITQESDQLKQLLTEIAKDESEITRLKQLVNDTQAKLADADSELEAFRKAPPAAAPDTALTAERDKLKADLAQRNKDLADAETRHSEELLTIRASLQEAQDRRDELEKKAAAGTAAAAETGPLNQRVRELQARVDALEAKAIPFSEDELAILRSSVPTNAPATVLTQPEPTATPAETASTPGAAATSTNAAPGPHHFHSAKELPPGTQDTWDQGMRASWAGDYATAEDKFTQVLAKSPNNVYVLAFLANTQFAAGHLGDCENTVKRALASDPEDPGTLYLLGLLRYRQNKLDEAFDALSLSAKMSPTNAATLNFLGCVMAEKGMRSAAETSMRKALQYDPNYADAHFNLALVYAGNQPPAVQLATYHYKRAVALGHDKNANLEKLLNQSASAQTPAAGQ